MWMSMQKSTFHNTLWRMYQWKKEKLSITTTLRKNSEKILATLLFKEENAETARETLHLLKNKKEKRKDTRQTSSVKD